MAKHTHRCHNLRKRCSCPWRQWAKCSHPWHFFFKWQGREYRFQLNEAAGKPAGYPMLKTEAEGWRDRFRGEIKAGTFRMPGTVPPVSPASAWPSGAMTFGELAGHYLEQYVRVPTRRPLSREWMEYLVASLRRIEVPTDDGRTKPLAAVPLASITKSDVEEVRKISRAHLPRAKGGEVGANRLLARLRHMFNWAITEGYIDHTPFKRFGVTVVKLSSCSETPRRRRLEPGEEERLLAAASRRLRSLIIAALETGCRLGELLSMQWHQIRWAENAILLPAAKTKTNEARAVPMTKRLRTMLEASRRDPFGGLLGPDAYVFGNEVGERTLSIRTAWENCRRRAAVKDLHFHDLRREFGSRLLESGAAGHEVRDWLGHTTLLTTNQYRSTTGVGLQQAQRRFDESRGSKLAT